MRIKFVCKKCGKQIEVEQAIHEQLYLNQSLCLSCRNSSNPQAN